MKREIFKFLIILSVLFSFTLPQTQATINVGTTLFSESDVYKKCWSSENVAILTSRMILEDLLPAKDCLVINSNDFINDIIQYFRLILEVIRRETFGKTKHITLMALTDLLGGYLNHAVLPVAKHSYYAGIIDYPSIEKLIQLFDELKWFLRTNGQGWTAPIQQDPYALHAEPIAVQTPTPAQQPCNGLVTFNNVHIDLKGSSSSAPGGANGGVAGGAVNGEGNTASAGIAPAVPGSMECPTTAFLVPLPFFDSKYSPSAIAVPFRAFPLRNIESQCSAYVILKYYIAGHKCILSKHQKVDRNLHVFDNNLYTWLVHEVVPKLDDEKFYAAFGGVMRVVNTLKNSGATEVDLTKVMHGMNEISGNKTDTIEEVPPAEDHISKKSILLIALLIIIALWFMIGTIFICFKIMKKGGETKSRSSRPSNTASGTPTSDTKSSFKLPFPCSPKIKDRSSKIKAKPEDSQTTEGFEQVDLSDTTGPQPAQQQVTNYACHSSLTGDYAMENKRLGPYVFPYDDFETSSDESTSRAASDTEAKSGASK